MTRILHIQLLGDFSLVYGDTPVTTVNSPRVQSLLAYLLLHRHAPQARHHLAFLLWPDSTEAQAQTNLRQLLHHLRRVLPEAGDFLHTDAKTLQWQVDAPFRLDVADFEGAVANEEQLGHQAATRLVLEGAIAVYRGDLLPSCYDEWLLPERERLRQRFSRTLERLIQLLEEQRDYPSAIRYAQHLLRHDPLHEATYRHLMRLHALNNDRASALRVYHTCTTVLQRELDVEPSLATRQAYERLLNASADFASASPSTLPVVAGQALPSRSPALMVGASLVGRQPEWESLQAAWRTAAGGQAYFVLVAGEAGIGKTRLAEELLQWAGQQGLATVRTRSYAAEGRLAYAPVTDWLRADAFRATLLKLDEVWLTEVARLLPELLVERPNLPKPEPLTENWQRRRLFEALARATLTLASRQPLLLVIDDLQWCDQETLEWLHYLLRFDPQARLLIVGTVRPEEVGVDHPLTSLLLDLRSLDQLTEIELGPLDQAETVLLAGQVAGQELGRELAAQLYRETEGYPLFVVETVRAVSGDRTARLMGVEIGISNLQSPISASQSLPPKVQAVIKARLAQLSPSTRELAGLAATIGRAFTFEVLARASDSDEDTVVRGLDELWQRHIVREQGADAYDFSHDKIRDVAYAGVSAVRRRRLHRRVARALETAHTSNLDPVSAQIAAHYEQASLPQQAIPYYRRAAEVAQRVYANQETISLLTRGLALLKTLSDSPERDEKELELQLALGVPMVAIKGYSAVEVMEVYSQARELGQRLGKPPNPPVLRALAIAYNTQSEVKQAYELGAQLLGLAQRQQDSVLLVEGHYILGVTSFWLGEFGSSRTHLEQALAHYTPQQRQVHLELYTQDPQVICLSRLAWTLWYLGYPDQAVEKMQQALTLARVLTHPYSLAYALYYSTSLYHDRRDDEAMRAQVETTVACSIEHGFSLWLSVATMFQGWSWVKQGQVEAGMARIQEGLAGYRNKGALLNIPTHLGLLAQAFGQVGEIEQGLSLVIEALAIVAKIGGYYWEAEFVRLKGELLLKDVGGTLRVKDELIDSSPEACFLKAIEIARRQEAKSLQLRAVVSLSHLWRERGHAKRAEARQMLAEIYDWFTEGFDTADLREAKALLEELS